MHMNAIALSLFAATKQVLTMSDHVLQEQDAADNLEATLTPAPSAQPQQAADAALAWRQNETFTDQGGSETDVPGKDTAISGLAAELKVGSIMSLIASSLGKT